MRQRQSTNKMATISGTLAVSIRNPTASLLLNDVKRAPGGATDTIDYVTTDQNDPHIDLRRTVIIEASPSIVPTDNASTTQAASAAQ
jgi:hypothetical protein